LIVWKLYYGTPVPLPSIVKTAASPYGKHVARMYGYGNLRELFLFSRENFIALGYCSIFFVLWRRVTRTRLSIADLSLALGALAYAAFQAFGNKFPITSGAARFFMPVLPILLYFSIRGFALALKAQRADSTNAAYSRKAYNIGVAAVAILVILQGTLLIRQTFLPVFANARNLHFSSAHDALIGQIRHENKWTAMLGALTDPHYDHCTIADSELGGIGLLPPSRAIFDMSGLNNTDMIVHHEPAKHYLLRKLPDYIWYQRVNFYQDLRLDEDVAFKNLYDFHPEIGVATRRGSGCVAE
jgi:hypothetical protein